MNPVTLNTILNSAPLILQGAGKLIKLIRERNDNDAGANVPLSIEGLKQEVMKLEERIETNSESDVEQIRLIEQLARHNEAIAGALKEATLQLKLLTLISLAALLIAGSALILLIFIR